SEGRKKFLESLQKGERRKGTVSSIVNFGAFVDLGGVDGLVHVSELSWKHVDHPSEVVQVGQEVDVEVLDVDLERERVSLSLKATMEDPWREFERKHATGEVVTGTVTKLVPFGAFVRVGEGIEGAEARADEGSEEAFEAYMEPEPESPEESAMHAVPEPDVATPPAAQEAEGDVTLESILEDLKRREGRT